MVESESPKYALHECRRQLAALLHHAPGMAYRCQMDCDWTMEFLSEGCHALTGYCPQDLVHNTCATYASLIHPEDRPMVYDVVADAVGAKRSFQIEYRIIAAGGVEKWVLGKGQAIFDNKTEDLTFIEGFISDITEQKRSEALLKDEIAQRRMLVDQSRDGIGWIGIVADLFVRPCERPSGHDIVSFHLADRIKMVIEDWRPETINWSGLRR